MRPSKRSFIVLFQLLLLLAGAAHADTVDDLVRARMHERNIPGAAVAVIKNGRVIKMRGYGLASVEFDIPVTTETVFEIGSVSKQMTAAGIMLLVQEGKVKLDEKISAYLPNTPEAWNEVTVRHLLTHTSGIKSYTSLDGFELSRRVKIDGFIKQLAPYPLEFQPGEKNIYSNSGFNLLAYIIETQSGKPFMEFMRTKIFLPLGMTKTADRDPQFVIKKRANGYEWNGERLTGRDGNLTDLMGAGAIVSTIGDMVKWENALRGDRLLTPESKREIWTKFTFTNGESSPYGFGWRLSDVRGHTLVGHTGQTSGFGAAIFRYVDDNVTVITLTNLGELGMGSMIASAVAKQYIPSLSLRSIGTTVTVAPRTAANIRDAVTGRYSNSIKDDIFTASLARRMRTGRAKALTERLGKLAPVTDVRVVEQRRNGNTISFDVIARTRSRIFLWQAVVDADGKISELSLEEEE